MKQYRILQVHNFYQIPGGEDSVVRNEKRLLEEHGHKVYTYYRSNEELKEKGILGKLLLPFTAVYSIKTKREVQKLIKEHQIDIVHVHNTLTMVSPSVFYAAFRCHVPVVQTLHNFRMLCPAGSFFRDNRICEECVNGGLQCAIKHKCYRNSRMQTIVSAMILKVHRILGTYKKVNFICLTKFNKNKMLSGKNVVDEKKLYIKPHFTYFVEKCEEKPVENYYLFAGRLEPLKGVELVIKAFEQMPDRQLYLAGSGELEEQIKDYVKSHHMKNVRFLGYLKKDVMASYFSNAKAVIMASQCYETFGMTIAEAYSYGTPVIAGKVGNLDGMVEEGVTGVKFQYDSAEDLMAKIEVFEQLEQSKLRENAKKFYEERLMPEDNYQRLMEIYESILNDRK